jgi:hypothetical protein
MITIIKSSQRNSTAFDLVSYVQGSLGREGSTRALLAWSLIKHYLCTLYRDGGTH